MSRRLERVVLWTSGLAIAVFSFFPAYWLLITSVKTPAEVVAAPPVWWPSTFDWSNYAAVLDSSAVRRSLANSVIVSVTATCLTIVIGTMAAYVLAGSRLAPLIRGGLVVWILATRTFPPITTAIPYFVLVSNLHLIDTIPGLVLTYVSMTLPFAIWLIMGFFRDLPQELEEAALMDGCGTVRRLVSVLVPLLRPGLAVAFVLVFITAWNEFLFASILTASDAKTLPVVLAGYSSNQYQRWGEMAAIGSLMMIPLLVIAAAAQRHLIRGLTFGAVKG